MFPSLPIRNGAEHSLDSEAECTEDVDLDLIIYWQCFVLTLM